MTMQVQPPPRRSPGGILPLAWWLRGSRKRIAVWTSGCVAGLVAVSVTLLTVGKTVSPELRFEALVFSPTPTSVREVQYGAARGFVDGGLWAFKFKASPDDVERLISKHQLAPVEGGLGALFWRPVLREKTGLEMEANMSYAVYASHSKEGVLRLFWSKESGVVFLMRSSV